MLHWVCCIHFDKTIESGGRLVIVGVTYVMSVESNSVVYESSERDSRQAACTTP